MDHERLRTDDRVPVAELGAEVGLRGQAGQPLDHVPREHRRVERRAARDQHDALDRLHGRDVEVHVGNDDVAGLRRDAAAEGVGDGARLLVDLLEHEVPVAALLGHDRIPEDADGLALDRLAVERRELDAVRGDDRHLAVLEDDHVTRVGQDRRDVGRDEHLAAPEAHDDAPGAVLGRDEPVGRGRRDHADGVRAGDLGERRLHGCVEATVARQVMLDEMGEHLGVGVGAERVPGRLQPLLDLDVVLEDAVVHHDEIAGAVGVRMRVLLGRPTVRGPSRVADADGAGDGPLAQHRLQRLQPARGAPDVQPARVEHGDAGGIVAAVLETPETVDDDVHRALLADVPDDSAHVSLPSCGRPAAHGAGRPIRPS
jgi:hypothetical protein